MTELNQRPLVFLLYKETKTTEKTLVEIFAKREHFINWLNKHYEGNDVNDSFYDFCTYNKHIFDNGDILELKPYQLNDYEEK